MNKNSKVDKYGIRLAPAPMDKNASKTLSTVVQPCELVASVSIEEKGSKGTGKDKKYSTTKDFQPEATDVNRPYKRKRRIRNFFAGLLILIICAVTIAPFIIGYFGKTLELPFNYSFSEFNVLSGLEEAITTSMANGWKGDVVNAAWISAVPSLILLVGLLAVVCNLLKALVSMCGALKGRYFGVGAVIFLMSVVAIFVASLVGAEQIGITKIDFMTDIYSGWRTSEIVTLAVLALINVLGAIIAKYISPNNSGY